MHPRLLHTYILRDGASDFSSISAVNGINGITKSLSICPPRHTENSDDASNCSILQDEQTTEKLPEKGLSFHLPVLKNLCRHEMLLDSEREGNGFKTGYNWRKVSD